MHEVGRLVDIDESNWQMALGVRIPDDQLPLVAAYQPVALVILAKAYVQPGGRSWEPLAHVAGNGALVAVLALAHAGSVTEVVNLVVDASRQGQGIGTAAMRAVIARARQRGSTTLELTVHPANEPAARLYRRLGLSPTGSERDGEPVWSVNPSA